MNRDVTIFLSTNTLCYLAGIIDSASFKYGAAYQICFDSRGKSKKRTGLFRLPRLKTESVSHDFKGLSVSFHWQKLVDQRADVIVSLIEIRFFTTLFECCGLDLILQRLIRQ